MVLRGLAPLSSPDSRLLILGSFPGVKSLMHQQYYAHPQNHFWKILGALWNTDLMAMPYQNRLDVAVQKGLAIWDVYSLCEREGSLDSNIKNAVVNDFSLFARKHPKLEAIAHNGGESFRHSKHTSAIGLPVYRLPSTSPANASWSFQKKLDAWREVFQRHGMA